MRVAGGERDESTAAPGLGMVRLVREDRHDVAHGRRHEVLLRYDEIALVPQLADHALNRRQDVGIDRRDRQPVRDGIQDDAECPPSFAAESGFEEAQRELLPVSCLDRRRRLGGGGCRGLEAGFEVARRVLDGAGGQLLGQRVPEALQAGLQVFDRHVARAETPVGPGDVGGEEIGLRHEDRAR